MPDAVPLFQCVMWAGRVVPPVPDLAVARQWYATDRAHLAESYRRLEGGVSITGERSAGNMATRGRNRLASAGSGSPCDVGIGWNVHVEALVALIGGAGTFDGVFLTGILAVLLA